MPVAPQRNREIARTIQLPGGGSATVSVATKATESVSVTANTSPRAGQAWHIGSLYYSLKATKLRSPSSTKPNGITYTIKLKIGSVVVAEQILKETSNPSDANEELPVTFVGSLEPLRPVFVYPGESVEVVYSVSRSGGNNAGTVGPGELLLSYTLAVR